MRIETSVVRALGAMIVLLVVAGCSGGGTSAVAKQTEGPSLAACTPLEPGENDRFLFCRRPNARDRGSFSFRGRGTIPIRYPYKGPEGHWSGGFLSPDGRTLLLQWTAECEVPFALFVSARGGTPRVVTGGRIEDARPSIAHGWTRAGRAIVEVLPRCDEARTRPRGQLWLVSRDGEVTRTAGARDAASRRR